MYEKIINLPAINLEELIGQCSNGLFLEFGVGIGTSIKTLAELTPNVIYGFDTFEGLPEDWNEKHPKGAFACDIPQDLPSNVKLVIGLFEDTLDSENVSFVHIDCDLYSSTKTLLTKLERRFTDNTIILFDEFVGYEGWEDHEYKAFNEFLTEFNWQYECLGGLNPHSSFRKAFRIFR